MPTLLMDPTSSPPRNAAPAAPVTAPKSQLAGYLTRCTAARLRLIVHAPADGRIFARGLRRFPDRYIDPADYAQWDTAYRVFCGSSRQPHDRGSWRVLAADADGRVVGAITARFFCGEVVREYVHLLSLVESAGRVFREQCELAVADVFAMSAQIGRTPAEISHWAVAPGRHCALVAATLTRALGGLSAAFNSPLGVLAADQHRGDAARLMRLGCAPLGRAGRFSLPPFVHQPSGAWLRLLLVDSPIFQARCGINGAADLALLRAKCPVISAS